MGERVSFLIDEIISAEHEMFVCVKSSTPAPCQQNMEGFRIFRKAHFVGWSVPTLESYLSDLSEARNAGRNLMMIKYGYMDGAIPYIANDPLCERVIERIVSIEEQWQQEILRKFPSLILRGRPINDVEIRDNHTSFVSYLCGELRTYSWKTLNSLLMDIENLVNRGLSKTEMIYKSIICELGYVSLEEADRDAEKRARNHKD